MATKAEKAEEAELWVGWTRDAVAALGAELPEGGSDDDDDDDDSLEDAVSDVVDFAVAFADDMLEEYRARFGKGGGDRTEKKRRKRRSRSEDEK